MNRRGFIVKDLVDDLKDGNYLLNIIELNHPDYRYYVPGHNFFPVTDCQRNENKNLICKIIKSIPQPELEGLDIIFRIFIISTINFNQNKIKNCSGWKIVLKPSNWWN